MSRTFNAVILTYHSISEGPPPLCIPPDIFAAQMDWLRANACVVPLASLLDSLADSSPPPRAIALTFDDGFRDFQDSAVTTLRLLGLPATVFLPAAYCGKPADWDSHAGGHPVMSWEQIRELAAQGLSFGSHGMRHLSLDGRTDSELAYEVAESKRLIEAHTGQEINFFCYPYGSYDARARRAVSACYSGGACSTELRALFPRDDRYALPRIDAHYLRNPAIFRAIFTERFRLYLCARRFLRHLRSRRRSGRGFAS